LKETSASADFLTNQYQLKLGFYCTYYLAHHNRLTKWYTGPIHYFT